MLEFDGTSRIKRPLCNPRGDRANVSKQGWRRLKEREKKKKGKRRKRDDDIVCYPAVEKGW